MRLTHQLGRGTKVHLLLDDEYQITTSTTFWAEHYLPDGTEISEDDWQRLVQQINERKALNKAVELLSHRDHSAKELRNKLLRTADSDAADKAVAQMLDAGYLDDEKYARRLVRHLIEDKNARHTTHGRSAKSGGLTVRLLTVPLQSRRRTMCKLQRT